MAKTEERMLYRPQSTSTGILEITTDHLQKTLII